MSRPITVVINELHEFLNSHEPSDNSVITHVSMTKGRYSIDPDEEHILHNLIAEYRHAIANEIYVPPEIATLQLLEIPTEISNLHIDLDFKTDPSSKTRVYNNTFIHEFIDSMNDCIRNTIVLEDTRLPAFVLERAIIVEHIDYNSDGLHIVYPTVLVNKETRLYIRKLFLEKYKSIFNGMQIKNSVEEILDQATFKNNAWFLVGCGKEGDGRTYLPTKKFLCIDNELLSTDISNANRCSYEMIKSLSIRHSNSEASKLHDHVMNIISETREPISNTPEITNISNEELINLVKMLSPARSNDYTQWVEIGLALYNYAISGNCTLDDSRIAFHEFSKLSDKYNPKDTDKKFNSFRNNSNKPMTIGSIRYFARIDSPNAYALWRKTNENANYAYMTSFESYDYANVYKFAPTYEDIYAYYNDNWYMYNSVIWVKLDTLTAKAKIILEMRNYFISEINKRIAELTAKSENQESKELFDTLIKMQKNSLKKVKDIGFIRKVYEELMIDSSASYYKLFKGLDTAPYKIAFENGIYELDKGDPVDFNDNVFQFANLPDELIKSKIVNSGKFRESTISDLITKQIHIDYSADYYDTDEYKENVKILEKFFDDLFPLKSLRDYVLTIIAGFFEGKNRYQHFYIFLGVGSNGKSVLMEFLQSIFSDYSCSVSVSLITNKRASSSQATPDLISIEGKRLVTMQEPDHNSVLQAGLLKELTGTDRIAARGLYKDPVEFTPQASFVCACNTLPAISVADDFGTFRRIQVIPFETRFIPNYNEMNNAGPNDRPCVIDIIEQLKKCRKAFVHWILKVYYPVYILKAPYCDKVVQCTQGYQNDNDYYKTFVETMLIRSEDSVINISELFGIFKEYIKDNYPTVSASVSCNSFIEKLQKVYNIEVVGREVLNYSLRD